MRIIDEYFSINFHLQRYVHERDLNTTKNVRGFQRIWFFSITPYLIADCQ